MYTRIAHAFAGILILLSISLSVYANNFNWLWITALVGVNLLQNSITNWCLLHQVLKMLRIKDTSAGCST